MAKLSCQEERFGRNYGPQKSRASFTSEVTDQRPNKVKASMFTLEFRGFMEFMFQLLMFRVRTADRTHSSEMAQPTRSDFCSVSGPGPSV